MNFNYNGTHLGKLPGIEHLFMLGTGPDYYWSGEGSDAKDFIGFTGFTDTGMGGTWYNPDTGLVETATGARYPTKGGIKGLLAEPAGANILLQALTDWAATNCTIAKDATGAQGTANRAYTLTATADNATLIADALSSTHANHTFSAYVKRKTGTGSVYMTCDNGATYTEVTVTSGWTQLSATKAVTNPQVGFKLATSGDAIYIDYPQVEPMAFKSSAIDNDGVSAGADLVTDGAFANVTETNSYTSDFSAGVDGWSATRGSIDGNIDVIAGKDNCLRFTCDGVSGTHFFYKLSQFSKVLCYRQRVSVFIPSANSNIDTVKVYDGSGGGAWVSTTDTWVDVDLYFNALGTGFYVLTADNFTSTFQDAGADDVVYIHSATIDAVTLTDWTTGTGMAPEAVAGSLTGKVLCVAGTASSLTQSATAAEANKSYQVGWTITRTAGTIASEFGSDAGTSKSAAGTYYDYLISTDTDYLKFTKDADFAGTISAVTVKEWGNARPSEAGKCKFDLPSGLFAEALGSELVSNGSMETGDPPSGYTGVSSASLDGVADERTGGAGSQSLEVARGTADYCVYANTTFAVSGGQTLKCDGWIKNIDATNGEIRIVWTGYIGETSVGVVTSTSWTQCKVYIPVPAGATAGRIRLYVSGTGGQKANFDDISIKPVTNAWNGMPPHFTMLAWVNFGYGYPGASSILTANRANGRLFAASGSNGSIFSSDESSTPTFTANWAANTWCKLALQTYLDSNVYKFRVGVDSGSGISWGTPVAFDGAYAVGSYLNIFYTLFGPSQIALLGIWKRIPSDAEILAVGGSPS